MTKFLLFSGRDVLHTVNIGSEPTGVCLSIKETAKIGFKVTDYDSDANYQVTIGDIPVSNKGRNVYMDWVEWPAQRNYLDGASGHTVISLSDSIAGAILAKINLIVEPSKLTSDSYERMTNDIWQISAELLLDLIAKSRTSVTHSHFAMNPKIPPLTARLDLNRTISFWRKFSTTLSSILEDPNRRIRQIPVVRQINQRDKVDHRIMRTLVQHGCNSRNAAQGRMFPDLPTPLVTHDTVENQTLTSFLKLLIRRIMHCITLIEAEQNSRNMQIEKSKKNLKDVHRHVLLSERPKIDKLQDRINAAENLAQQIRDMIFRHMLGTKQLTKKEITLNLESPMFLNDSRYSLAARQMRSFIRQSGVVLKIGEDEGAKSIDKIYEQWVYFKICAALQASGLSCVSHKSIFEPIRRNQYSVDIDRSAAITFESAHGRRVRLRYEPTILPLADAQGVDSLYRGKDPSSQNDSSQSPWTPDIVIEILEPRESPKDYKLVYAVVIDAKYTTRYFVHDRLNDIKKYLGIRNVETEQQIVRQLWVAAPITPIIETFDDTTAWSEDGIVSAQPNDVIDGVLGIHPGNVDSTDSMLVVYIQGTLEHARRYAGETALNSSTSVETSSERTSTPVETDSPPANRNQTALRADKESESTIG